MARAITAPEWANNLNTLAARFGSHWDLIEHLGVLDGGTPIAWYLCSTDRSVLRSDPTRGVAMAVRWDGSQWLPGAG